MCEKIIVVVLSVALLLPICAAVPEPVAPGFVNWTGLDEKSHIAGRCLSPSDMRHRVTVVVELQAKAFKEQALATAGLAGLGEKLAKHGIIWEDYTPPRCLVVYSVVGKLADGAYDELRNQKALERPIKNAILAMCIYRDVSFDGCPQAEGKYPFVYVMGPEGCEPLYAGGFGKDGLKEISGVVKSAEKKLPKWRPYFGTVSDDNHYPQLAKSLETGKPALVGVLKDLQKGIVGKKEDLARESQILYDAVNQRRSDLEYLIGMESRQSPHVAYCHMQELFARWPSRKKTFAPHVAKIKSIPDMESVSKAYVLFRQCADLGFVPKSAAEAKRMSAQLLKQKPFLEKARESQDASVQNAAFRILQDLEAVAESLLTRVVTK